MSHFRLTTAIVAYALLAYGLDRLPPASKGLTLLVILGALAVALLGSCRRQARLPSGLFTLALLGLAVIVWWELIELARLAPGLTPAAIEWNGAVVEQIRSLAPSAALAYAALLFIGLLTITYAWRSLLGSRWRIALILGLYAYVAAWFLLSAPRPVIDVLALQEQGAALLLEGHNPYAADYPNLYSSALYLPLEVLRGKNIHAFPYPPLSLLAVLPGHLIGDIRWSMLAAVLLGAAFMVATGRAQGSRPGHPAELAVVAFLCHWRTIQVLQHGWTEPLLVLASSVAAWAAVTRHERILGFALAALATLKQHAFLCLPALLRAGRPAWRKLVPGAAVALVILLGFLAWDPAALWRGLVTWLLHSPYRRDSLTIPAMLTRPDTLSLTSAEQTLLAVLSLAAAGGVIGLVVRQRTVAMSQAALGNAAALLAFFVLSKAAHINYFWWVASFLALAAVTAAAEAPAGGNQRTRG